MALKKLKHSKNTDHTFKNLKLKSVLMLVSGLFANSALAIDQGPIIVMIENYRSGLLWNLFTGAPEIKNGMRRLGFTAPYL